MSNPGQLHDGHEADRGIACGFPAADEGSGDEGLPPAMPGALARALRPGYRGPGRGPCSGALELEAEAMSGIDSTPCIRSGARINDRGYSIVWHAGKPVREHRLVFAQSKGLGLDAIAGKVVRHKCDNPACVNPEHLELGTQAENVLDMLKRGRKAPTIRGSAHRCSKLTESDIPEIRKRLSAGESQRSIAKRFGVDQAIIKRISSGKAWSHVRG